MKKCVFLSAAAVAAVLFGGRAFADTISFNFTGSGANALLHTFTDAASGLRVTVGGLRQQVGDLVPQAAQVSRGSNGLGVVGNSSPEMNGSRTYNEGLVFSFLPNQVTIERMEFRLVDLDRDDDEVRMQALDRSGMSFGRVYNLGSQLAGSQPGTVNFVFNPRLPSGFAYVASTTDWDDNYSIAGITVDYTRLPAAPTGGGGSGSGGGGINNDSGGHAVPTPATALGGLALMGVLGVGRWYRGRRRPV